ncbi:MAG: hypothetical protein GF421_12535 [Candidatus Aminicenantes bacterium]|nr:hypothetical protein [Candidatus Aminicenantes bacterium]
MKKCMVLILSIFYLGVMPSEAQEFNWYKGNTHCHTLNSDGDSYPRQVIRWYRDHEYNFLFITDHNIITEIKYLDTDPDDDFLLIQGEEVTDSYQGIPVHLNALNSQIHIEPQHGDSVIETLQNNADAILEAGAVPQINHPNWRWSFTDKEISQTKGVHLFELYNAHPDCNNFSAGGRPGMEDIWDKILSKGILMYGIASDDAHDYVGEFTPRKSNPGTGWIMVKARELSTEAIMDAIQKGQFFSTLGVLLKDICITQTQYRIDIKPYKDAAYTTTFIGQDGVILKEVYGTTAEYTFNGNELYVRARIVESSGRIACTQPVFLSKD